MPEVAKLAAIWIKRADREPMESVRHAHLVSGAGLRGNSDYGAERQITIIGREVSGALPPQIREAVRPSARRATWSGAAWGDVLDDGEIRMGDEVAWVE
ncbi:MAG: hypothetical protein JSW71_16210 [Gemmatimonadota bacterium]|nr:MAG: hypothetical protein JSW71_16210 [Gemmatimonadota bacterium]